MTTSDQLRAARAILALSQDEIAAMVPTSTKTIRRAETGADAVSEATIVAIRAALELAGVEFIAENGGGAGVRLRKRG